MKKCRKINIREGFHKRMFKGERGEHLSIYPHEKKIFSKKRKIIAMGKRKTFTTFTRSPLNRKKKGDKEP